MKINVPTKKAPGKLSFLHKMNRYGQLDPINYPEGLRCYHAFFSVKVVLKRLVENIFEAYFFCCLAIVVQYDLFQNIYLVFTYCI